MNSWKSGFVALLAVCLVASTARADVRTLATYGFWKAFGGTADDGKGVCGVSSEGAGLYFGMKVFSGDETVTLQLASNKWNLNRGDKIPVALQFDDYPAWYATGTGMRFPDGDAGIWFAVPRNRLRQFIMQFRAAYGMVVKFGGSGMSEWTGSLRGTNAVTDVFANCIGRLS